MTAHFGYTLKKHNCVKSFVVAFLVSLLPTKIGPMSKSILGNKEIAKGSRNRMARKNIIPEQKITFEIQWISITSLHKIAKKYNRLPILEYLGYLDYCCYRDNYYQQVYSNMDLVFDYFSLLLQKSSWCSGLLWGVCNMTSGTVSALAPPAALLHYCFCFCFCCRGISSLACRQWLGAVEHRHPLSGDSLLAFSSPLLSPCLSVSLLPPSRSCHNICSVWVLRS